MKQQSEMRFPYPFLQEEGGDYLNSKFEIDFDVEKTAEHIELSCCYELKCPFIEKLINDDKAVVCIHVEQRTFRKVYRLKSDRKVIIPIENLSPNYNLEVVGLIIAKDRIEFEYQECMNEIYSYFDKKFVCEKASILAFSNFAEFELPQEKKISSIFTISEYKDPHDIAKGEPYKIDLDGNVIDIKVLPTIKEKFVDLRVREASHNKLLNSVFVYPAIQIAIIGMFNNYESYKDYKWFISIANKLANEKECPFESLRGGRENVDKDELIEYTHIILEDLLTASFEEASGED